MVEPQRADRELTVLSAFLPVSPGGLQAIAELLQADCELYGLTADHQSITLRRYAGMALTNLTFGDVGNKVEPFVAVFFCMLLSLCMTFVK